jgi:type IV pilus assembly protein PilO
MDTEVLVEKIEKIKMPIRILILVGTVVVLAGVFIWLVYIPKSGEISKTAKNIESLEQKLRQVKIRLRDREKIKAEFEQVNTQFKEALKILPDSREIPTLLKSVDQLGKDSDLEFELFSPQNEVQRDFFIEIPVAIELLGTYHNVARFFYKVGKMERIMNIDDVSMNPTEELSTTLKTTCKAVTYRFKGNVDVDEEKSDKK